MQKAFIILIAFTLVACDSLTPEACKSCDDRSEEFLKLITQGDTLNAYRALGNAAEDSKPELQSLIKGTNKLLRMKGRPYGFEVISSEMTGTRVLKYRYLLYHKQHVSEWSLSYYKTPVKGEWVVTGVAVSVL